jgi:hypothetical protein
VYKLSYLYYGLLSVIIVFLVGIVLSLLTGPIDPKTLDRNLFYNFDDFTCFGLRNIWKRARKNRKREENFSLEMNGQNNLAIDLSDELTTGNDKIKVNQEKKNFNKKYNVTF